MQVETQNKRIEKVFRKIQPTLALDIVFKITVPIAGFRSSAALWARYSEGKPW